MKVTQQFDSVYKLHDHSGHHPRRSIQLDMEKLLEQLQGDNGFDHVRGTKHSKLRKIQANMTRKLPISNLDERTSTEAQDVLYLILDPIPLIHIFKLVIKDSACTYFSCSIDLLLLQVISNLIL